MPKRHAFFLFHIVGKKIAGYNLAKEGPNFSIEALDYEQEKQEKLLEAANKERRKVEPGKVREFLSGMDEYTTELKKILMEKRAELRSPMARQRMRLQRR